MAKVPKRHYNKKDRVTPEQHRKVVNAFRVHKELRQVLPKTYAEYPEGWVQRFGEYPVWQEAITNARKGDKVECVVCGGPAMDVDYYCGLCDDCWCETLWYCMTVVQRHFDEHPEELFSEDHTDQLMIAIGMIDKAKEENRLKELVKLAKGQK